VAPPDRVLNPLQRKASRTAASTEIVISLEPERAALDPLHHVVGHDPLRGPDVTLCEGYIVLRA
jgi:hypothetical protein